MTNADTYTAKANRFETPVASLTYVMIWLAALDVEGGEGNVKLTEKLPVAATSVVSAGLVELREKFAMAKNEQR